MSTFAVLGASGKLGRAIVRRCLARGHRVCALVRAGSQDKLAGLPIDLIIGDACDSGAVRATVRGSDAVISALGPDASAAGSFSVISMRVLIDAMNKEHVSRIAIVTGAMIGPRDNLGWFYRRLSRVGAIPTAIRTRRAAERLLEHSGLTWTIVRPPRLSDGRVTRAPDIGIAPPIAMLDAASREDVATVLIDAAEGAHVDRAIYCRSLSDGKLLRSWILRCGLAEMAGIALAALAFVALTSSSLLFAACLLAGAAEGAMIGWAQGSILQRIFPGLNMGRFVGLTAAVVVAAWAAGMAPSTFSPATQGAADISLSQVMIVSMLGGAMGGIAIALAQRLELRRHTRETGLWIAASALGWAVALPLDVIAASIHTPRSTPTAIVMSGALFGLLAGVAFAIPTGLVALRYKLKYKDAVNSQRRARRAT